MESDVKEKGRRQWEIRSVNYTRGGVEQLFESRSLMSELMVFFWSLFGLFNFFCFSCLYPLHNSLLNGDWRFNLPY